MSQAGGGAAPEKSPAQSVAVRNRGTIGQFSVAATYCSRTVDNPLRINADEPNWEGGVLVEPLHEQAAQQRAHVLPFPSLRGRNHHGDQQRAARSAGTD